METPGLDFFDFKPTILGFVLDIKNFISLERVKQAMIAFSMTLESATEDKLYVYRPGVTSINRWIASSVADIVGYKSPADLDPEAAITHTLITLSVEDPENNKHIFYITDRKTESRHRRVERAINLDVTLGTGCKIWLIDLGAKEDPLLTEASHNHPGACYLNPGIDYVNSEFFKELIYAQDYTA